MAFYLYLANGPFFGSLERTVRGFEPAAAKLRDGECKSFGFKIGNRMLKGVEVDFFCILYNDFII